MGRGGASGLSIGMGMGSRGADLELNKWVGWFKIMGRRRFREEGEDRMGREVGARLGL